MADKLVSKVEEVKTEKTQITELTDENLDTIVGGLKYSEINDYDSCMNYAYYVCINKFGEEDLLCLNDYEIRCSTKWSIPPSK